MQIKRRSLPMYILLNCLTLGIYGFIVSQQIGNEVNAICKGDGEEPRFGYTGAVLIRGISAIVGLIAGLVLGLLVANSMSYFSMFGLGEYKAIAIFVGLTEGGLLGSILGSVASGIYLKYWWYKQASRLKLNGYRYGLTIKESGVDNFLFRTVINWLFIPINLVLWTLTILIPGLILWLISLADSMGATVIVSILLFLFSLPLMFFGAELTVGANFATFFMFKNLNRYAKVYKNGGEPFDVMGYEYYPSVENQYPNFLPNMINGTPIAKEIPDPLAGSSDVNTTVGSNMTGQLIGVKGSCAGYGFQLNAGEEIVIGKDAKMASVVIDPAFKEVSRKHVSVRYDMERDAYYVTDFSSNGTWVDGERLIKGQPVYVSHGSEIKLANGKNVFQLG